MSIDYKSVETITGQKEILSGRVKTMHPKILGAILADTNKKEHLNDLDELGADPINLVVCNLYPFTSDPSIELIDVGGPTMVRAAAKNCDRVAVVVDPDDYDEVLKELENNANTLSDTTRLKLAAKAFEHVAQYDIDIAKWARARVPEKSELPEKFFLGLNKHKRELRYGENPHQYGALYFEENKTGWLRSFEQISGKDLSFLNILDSEAAWRLAHEIALLNENKCPAVCIIKHANPCGAAIDKDLNTAYLKAISGDPVSAFGGIVAVTVRIDNSLAEVMAAQPQADVIIAPDFDPKSIEVLQAKRKNTRLLKAQSPGPRGLDFKRVDGGFLVQVPDIVNCDSRSWQVVTERTPSLQESQDAELAWLICARTSSNAIVLVRDGHLVGVGAGQQSRLDAAKIAVQKAGDRAKNSAGASDAFFPFRDGLDVLATAGVSIVVSPGSSIRDSEVIKAANEQQISMYFTGERHFRH
jgi:phosphoribosylaminoimidazolecarboxamide formyltransferase/IMP cyclohydrolase